MKYEPVEMKEIHEIRERFHDETKALSDKEYIVKLNKEAAEFEKSAGKKFKHLAHVRT
jgi:hypothetical protein